MRFSICDFQRLTITAIVLACAHSACADTLWISSGGNARALEIGNVKVLRVQDGKIVFQTNTGREATRDLLQLSRIQLDDEPALTPAEEAYATQKWDAATDAYQKLVRSTSKAWLKEWASVRLLDSASKSNRFDAAVTAYIAIILADPERAAKLKPALPDEKSTYLTSAATEITAALATPKLTPEQQRGLLGFLLEIQRTRKDSKGVADATQQLLKLSGSSPNDTSAATAMAKLKLDAAIAALQANDPKKAIAELQSGKALFTDPQDQAHALFLTADATAAVAGDNADAGQLKDVALAYMRVVAHFKDVPGAPYVADSLLKVAAIHEKLNEKQIALQLYEEIAAQYKNNPAGPKATESVNRLKAKGG